MVEAIRIEVPSITLNISMFGLILGAKKFQEAAEVVVVHEGPQETGWHPVGKFLACQSIELSLKAFLRLRGATNSEVEWYGHRIAELLARARENNLREFLKLSGDELKEIRKASKYYEDQIFRYPDVYEIARAYPGDPNIAPLLSAAEKLVKGLYDPIRAAA
jgi:HEPN domain-containing protein